ncbi:carboxymuconolactone decarboxylase family protein [Desulfosporosinus sp. BG]|uniref:carboxymuconolactone decarboxylase family protein n=1 Tax=Desulfosporosinus sp. BG TaxID=1633135 RepID=UPI000858EE98|nr:carboxymuconolactone decarboxylase family protein [Desulfosporosinus sp. BG]ODA40458.1 4-carboxymuconolactone decarboxylase [Desulfosporosinus sp. BG]
MAKSFDFIHGTNEILISKGIELPLEGQSTTNPDTRMEKGLNIQKEIVGAEAIDKMYDNSPESQIHIRKYLSANCFGDYYTRNGLDIKTRELLTFAMLIAMGGCEPQAKGHIMANLNVGNDKQLLLSVVTNLLPYIGYPRTLSAISYLNEMIPESQ